MYDIKIKIKNYKCFEEESGFDSIKRVNLIIGRNNSGKSSLLDLINAVASNSYNFNEVNWRSGNATEVIFESKISDKEISRVFQKNISGGAIYINHYEYGKKFIGKNIKWSLKPHLNTSKAKLLQCDEGNITPPMMDSGLGDQLAENMSIYLNGKIFKRLSAERDILSEKSNVENFHIENNGSGITNAIQCYINKSDLPSELIEKNLLNGLNTVFAHDAVYTDIVCQFHDYDSTWEIYLEENYKGRIALSQSGSGLKTVICVLANLILIPHIEKKNLNDYIFGFEELENNIHPALLRRLNEYIYQASVEHDFIYFLTTHSNVLIDQFSKQEDAQIIHVTHNQNSSTCKTVTTYIESHGILTDLNIRASDILQSNGIIWVEGPSDRTYINWWINLWSNGELKEGTHYSVVIYGGRLLSHLSADDPEGIDDCISILRTNRNAIMLIDSDKKYKSAKINATKRRIEREFEKMNAFYWITKGKEIENYIPPEAVNELLKISDAKGVNIYENFFDYLNPYSKGQGDKYRNNKVQLAEMITPHMTRENLNGVLDLDKNMQRVCKEITNWNS